MTSPAEIYKDKFQANKEVECKVELFSLNAIDQVNHTYSAAVYVQVRAPKGDNMTLEKMEKINVEFVNLKSTDRDKRDCGEGTIPLKGQDGKPVMEDGKPLEVDGIMKHIVVVGDWCSPMELKEFPMDVQTLKIAFEVWDEDDMSQPLIPKPFGESIAKGFMLNDGFQLKEKVKESYEVVGGEGGIPTFTMEMTISRKTGFYTFNYILPISLMSTLSFCVLGIDVTEIGDRLSTVLTLLLTVVAYKMALACNLPVMSSMCLLDKYLSGAFLIMFIITILCSMGSDSRPWVDTFIGLCMFPWLGFNVYVFWRLWKYKKATDSNTVNTAYEKIN